MKMSFKNPSQVKAGPSTRYKFEPNPGTSSKYNQPAGPSKPKPSTKSNLADEKDANSQNLTLNQTTMSGLPWSVRDSKSLKKKTAILKSIDEPKSQVGIYTYTYGLTDADRKGHHPHTMRHDSLVLHHPKTEEPGPSASTTPFPFQTIPINEREFLAELTRNRPLPDSDDDDDTYEPHWDDHFKRERHTNILHDYHYNHVSATSVREMLLNAGFLPTQSVEMLEFYKDLEDQQNEGFAYAHTSTSNISLQERREAQEAFAGPSHKPPKSTKYKSDRSYKGGSAKPKPHDEPHPMTFINPKIKIQPARQQTIIETQLNRERNLANPKMNSTEYDDRKRMLMDAALKAYDGDKTTDEILVDLVDTPRDPILYHNIQHDDLADTGDLNLDDYGLNDDDFRQASMSTMKTIASLGGLSNTASHNFKSMFSGVNVPKPRPLDHFKGSIMGSVMREIEEENPQINEETPIPSVRSSSSDLETRQNMRKREIAKQTLATYKMTKAQQLVSLQRPKEMKLISTKQANSKPRK